MRAVILVSKVVSIFWKSSGKFVYWLGASFVSESVRTGAILGDASRSCLGEAACSEPEKNLGKVAAGRAVVRTLPPVFFPMFWFVFGHVQVLYGGVRWGVSAELRAQASISSAPDATPPNELYLMCFVFQTEYNRIDKIKVEFLCFLTKQTNQYAPLPALIQAGYTYFSYGFSSTCAPVFITGG